MAPKNRAAGSVSPAAAPPQSSYPSAAVSPPKSSLSKSGNEAQDIISNVWQNYLNKTPQRTKLIDVFLAFIAVVGALQFVYCVVAGNFPFNAFLAGFSACVGQFVLTISLRMQTNPENAGEFKTTSNERAFADYVFGSLLLHFFCINFIN